jgi:hypothetical protein
LGYGDENSIDGYRPFYTKRVIEVIDTGAKNDTTVYILKQ